MRRDEMGEEMGLAFRWVEHEKGERCEGMTWRCEGMRWEGGMGLDFEMGGLRDGRIARRRWVKE